MNNFEKDLKRAYEKGTQNASDKKDEVWALISRNLEEQKMSRNKYRKKNKVGLIIAAAAATLVVISAFTPAGQAAVAKIIDFFAPEKEVEVELEGMTEEAEYQLHTPEITQPAQTEDAPIETGGINQAMTYAIYIDGSRYETKTADGVDWIKPVDFPENYPEVSMGIYQVTDRTPSEVEQELSDTISGNYDTFYGPEEVKSPVDSIHIYAHDGFLEGGKEDLPQWDSEVIDIYLADNTQGGTFVITLKYFMEAAEGHAQRLKDMLQEFIVIPAQ